MTCWPAATRSSRELSRSTTRAARDRARAPPAPLRRARPRLPRLRQQRGRRRAQPSARHRRRDAPAAAAQHQLALPLREHDALRRASRRAAARPLDRVFLVSTGSEANDLALRLARAATRRADVICIQRRLPRLDDRDLRGRDELGRQPAGRGVAARLVHPSSRRTPTAARFAPKTPDVGPRYADSVRETIAALHRDVRRGVHLRVALRQRRWHRPAGRLPRSRVRARARGRRRVHRRRGADRARAARRALLGLRAAGRCPRHRGARQAARQRPPDRCGRHDRGDRATLSTTASSSSPRSAAARCRARGTEVLAHRGRRATAGECAGGRRGAAGRTARTAVDGAR